MLDRLKTRLLCATMLGGMLALAASAAQAADLAKLSGNVAAWVPAASKVGTAKAGQSVDIVVHMRLRDPATLKQVADAVSKPGNPQYGRYLSAAAFRARFAPDAADVAAVQAMLTQAGMTDVVAGPAGAYVAARATVAQISATFQVSQDLFHFGDRVLRANREEPSVPAALAGKIISIEGLDDTTFLKHPQHVSAVAGPRHAPAVVGAPQAITPPPVSANLPSPYCDHYAGDLTATLSTAAGPYGTKLPWLACGYTPQQIQAAYGFNRVMLDGTGVRVAILDAYASPTLESDGNRYAANHGLPPLTKANFSQIIPRGIYGVSPTEPCGPYGWWGEQSLDLAAVHGSAPGASILYVGARDCGTSLTVALLNTIYNQQADVITNSYSYNGEALAAADIATQDQAFQAAAAQGITVLFSTGDLGDLSQVNGVATGTYAADSPYVTGVGGTTLGLLNAHGNKGEWGWGTYRDYLTGATVNSGTSVTTAGLATTVTAQGQTIYNFAFYSGAGGGISLVEPQPAYQASVVPPALATTLNLGNGQGVTLTPRRVSPDISMVADPYTGYLIGESFTIAGNPVADAGCTPTSATTEYCEIPFGGTSLSSPLMAGVMAVMNQARMMAGKPLVGFANPLFYSQTVGTKLQGSAINDIVPPARPLALLRGYVNDLTRIRVVTVNSVTTLVETVPFPITVCAAKICEGLDDVFNYATTGYDDVTGLGVPFVPKLVTQ